MTKKRKPPRAATSPVVYCGPTIPGIAKQYTIYSNGPVPALAAAAQRNPAIGGLIIPLDRLPEAMRQLRTKSGSIYALYCRAGKN